MLVYSPEQTSINQVADEASGYSNLQQIPNRRYVYIFYGPDR